jgi:uncharacterized protein (UPF0548 family)
VPVLLSARRPSNEAIAVLLAASSDSPLSYAEVGATRRLMPHGELAGYKIDGASADLGSGDEVFERGCKAIDAWRMFDLDWVQLRGARRPAVGVTVAVVAQGLGLWVTNLARVVYIIDERDRYGFAYGTLDAHAERGEELFAVARAGDGSVTYELRAFSRPQRWWSRVAKPYVRARQARFRYESCAAMRRALDVASP